MILFKHLKTLLYAEGSSTIKFLVWWSEKLRIINKQTKWINNDPVLK